MITKSCEGFHSIIGCGEEEFSPLPAPLPPFLSCPLPIILPLPSLFLPLLFLIFLFFSTSFSSPPPLLSFTPFFCLPLLASSSFLIFPSLSSYFSLFFLIYHVIPLSLLLLLLFLIPLSFSLCLSPYFLDLFLPPSRSPPPAFLL